MKMRTRCRYGSGVSTYVMSSAVDGLEFVSAVLMTKQLRLSSSLDGLIGVQYGGSRVPAVGGSGSQKVARARILPTQIPLTSMKSAARLLQVSTPVYPTTPQETKQDPSTFQILHRKAKRLVEAQRKENAPANTTPINDGPHPIHRHHSKVIVHTRRLYRSRAPRLRAALAEAG